jgi:hypothetical protein
MIRRTTWRARLLNVVTGPLILYGCATSTGIPDMDATRGALAAQPGRHGLVIAAPHGTSDVRTADIAAELGRRTGFGVVIATGFAVEPDTRESAGRRYQVNRPMEGVPGRPPSEEVATDCARAVYAAYEARVREVARGPLQFLAEIHGNDHRDAAGQIEIATVGVDRELAFRLRAMLELIRDAHLRAYAQAPRLDVRIEPADTLRYTASGAKRCGILRVPERALHIELPKAARTEWREVYTAILADFLVQAAAYDPGR